MLIYDYGPTSGLVIAADASKATYTLKICALTWPIRKVFKV